MSWYFDLLAKRDEEKQMRMLSAKNMALDNRFDRGQQALSEAQSMQPIPQGGISVEEFVSDKYQPNFGATHNPTKVVNSLMKAGYSQPESMNMISLLSPQEQTKQSTLQQQFDWFSAQDKNTQDRIMDFRKAGAQTINVGTNMKPPGGYRFKNPSDPQSSPVEPIPGGPATRGTSEQQKKIASFEGIRGMVNAMQQGLKDGVDPNSLSMTTTEMLKGVPVLGSMWEDFNGDAKKEAAFLNETENFGNTALQIMRGAQVGPAELILFKKSLPTTGMTKAQYENALNTSIRIFNDSMRSTMSQLGGGQPFEPIAPSDIFSTDQANRLEELRRKRDGTN